MTPLEALGQKALEFDSLNQEYKNLLLLVVRLKNGAVRLEDVQVNLAANSWQIVEIPPVANGAPEKPAKAKRN